MPRTDCITVPRTRVHGHSIIVAFRMAQGRKNGRANGGRRRQQARARADRQLAQGTGRAVRMPFLVAPRAISLRGWDAFDPCHLPLPRATGPYAVVRTSALIDSSAKYIQFGAFKRNDFDGWSNVVAIEDVVSGTAINGLNNARYHTVPAPGGTALGATLSVVPAAISVQLMNPQALQSTSGIIAGATCHTQLDINNRIETWDDLSTEFISFFRPRLMSAGKLALRGVQVNSFPLNMSAIADFRRFEYTAGSGVFTLDGDEIAPEGWSPIVFINQNGVGLQYLVSVEWRVRFDIGNPAVASHAHHGVTPDGQWNNLILSLIHI